LAFCRNQREFSRRHGRERVARNSLQREEQQD
jgi:hypothetical protein